MVHMNIHLENTGAAVYFAGQTLKGTIELHLDQPKKVNGLYFIVNGQAHCSWSEQVSETVGTGDNRRTEHRTVYYEGTEVYLNTKTYLHGHQGGSSIEMASGTYRYNFECLLPPNIPASFEGSKGYIRYYVEACLDIPWRFDKETRVIFNLVRHDDLNEQFDLKMPCKQEEFAKFCCLFCQSDPMLITATIPFSGFTPGQIIPLTINYDNKSTVKVDRTKVNLKRFIRYTSYTPRNASKYDEDKMAEKFLPGINGGESKSFQVDLEVPQISMSSNTRFCNVVQIYYELKVEAMISGCHSNVPMIFPITIGAVPINLGAPQMSYQVPAFQPMPAFPNAPYPTAPIAFNGGELPPPSFDEAVKMDQPKSEFSNVIQPQGNIGWNALPSAPQEK